MVILIILCFVPRVFSEVSLHHVFVSRKSRSNSDPFETGYVYKKINDSPGKMSNFDSALAINKIEPDHKPSSGQALDPFTYSLDLEKVTTPKGELIMIEKSKSKDNSRFLPSKLKTDSMYERLKSGMHYKPPFKTETVFGYETEYHVDDDDVRTSSRGLYDSWPYYHYNPYEYENMRIDAEREKAKDKRYAIDIAKVIPIHEDLSHDIPYSQEPLLTTTEYYFTSTDNPMSGHEPFFSFMLNDYYNNNHDYEDELTLRGIDWNKDFHDGTSGHENENFAGRVRRLPSNLNKNINSNNNYKINEAGSESVTEHGISNQREFNKHDNGHTKKMNDRTRHQKNELQQTGFKDFVDNFANKFGSEDHNKDSKYISKKNQDKGENRKGFRRVYHKDEYQEENEFYDNNNSSVHSEDKGNSNTHIGGSEGLLKSTAYANLGNQVSSTDKSGNAENNKYENNHHGYNKNNEYNTKLHKYRDEAKQTTDYSE